MDHNTILLYFAICLVSYIFTKKFLHKSKNYAPRPFPTLPILGHLHLLKDQNSIHRTLSKLAHKHGPVLSLEFGSRLGLLVSSPSAAEDCLHHNDITFANRPRLIAGKILGYDFTTMLWAPYGPLWRNHRKIASTEILSTHRLNLLSDIRADEVRSLVKKLREGGGDKAVEVKVAFFELTNNVMMRMIAGKRIYGEAVESTEARKFREVVKELMETAPTSAVDFFPFLKYLGVHKKMEKKLKDITVKFQKFFQDLVDEKRKKMQEQGSVGTDCSKTNKTLIEVLLELQISDPSFFTDDMIKGLLETLLLGGTETSASTMEWALSLLLNNPEVLAKAQKEIDEHIGSDLRLIEESDLEHLPYLHCIINETLRMYPGAPILPPRESAADCVVGGYNVPKGTLLTLNIWALQNDPNIWDEPSKFKPERFENVKGERIGYQFIPFGAGRRACPGENLAIRIIGITLGSLIQCFDFEKIDEKEVDMLETVGVTMWRSNPLQVKCCPRNCLTKLL